MGLGSFRSALTSFLCVQPDTTEASQLSTLEEAVCPLLQLAQGPQETPKPSPRALPHGRGVTLENHARCVDAWAGQNPLAAFYDHAKKGKTEAKQNNKEKEVKCNDALLFLLFYSCGNTKEKVGTTGRERSVLVSYSLNSFFILLFASAKHLLPC